MVELVLEVLGTGLRLWDRHGRHKYTRKFLELQEVIREQRNTPALERDNIIYSNAVDELYELGKAFSSAAASADTSSPSE